MSQNNFPEQLIKGRIAETVFELMFREGTDCEIYPLGYEYTTPILKEYRNNQNFEHKQLISEIIDNFSNAPDFFLVSPDRSEIYIVEVKYRQTYEQEEMLEIATKLCDRWKHSHLFLATPEKFYYSPSQTIKNNKGKMHELNESLIPSDKQKYYHKLLMRFEK